RADADRLVMHPIRTPRIGFRAPGGIMLTSSTIEGTNIVTATYDGSLSAEDMDAVRTDLQATKAAHGSVRLLMEYGDIDIGRIEPEALWKDLKTAGMLGDIERCALVTDSNWIEKLGAAAGRVTSVEMLTFSNDQRDASLAWRGLGCVSCPSPKGPCSDSRLTPRPVGCSTARRLADPGAQPVQEGLEHLGVIQFRMPQEPLQAQPVGHRDDHPSCL